MKKYYAKIWMCFKTPMTLETTIIVNKTRMPDAFALEVELETGPNLTSILANMVA